MKRTSLNRSGKPLERRTPLKRSSMETARAWLARSKALGRKPMKRRYSDTGPDKATRQLVLERDAGQCQACGSTKDLQLHHRRPRQRGGDRSLEANLPSNLIVLCAVSHDHVERNRAEAYANGWLVHRPDDPASKAVLTVRGWVLLTPDGRAVPAEEPGP